MIWSNPAPGEYTPEKADNMKHHSPRYSFGMKSQPQRPVDTPGKIFNPNAYGLCCSIIRFN